VFFVFFLFLHFGLSSNLFNIVFHCNPQVPYSHSSLTVVFTMGFLGFMYRQLFDKPTPIPTGISAVGRTAIVTGSNVGLGLEATRELMCHDLDRVILAVRSLPKGEKARAELLQAHLKCKVEVWELDYDSFPSIIAFGKRARSLDRLDIVLLNAGVKKLEFMKSPSGHESTVQINHLATALLSLLLVPQLQVTAKLSGNPSRLTIVSSEVHMWSNFKELSAPSILHRMDKEDSFGAPERYNTSKLLNVLWTRELASKIDVSDVIINTVNPGFCGSSLHRDEISVGFRVFKNIFAWTSAQGGHCLVDAVIVKKEDTHGGYLSEQKSIP